MKTIFSILLIIVFGKLFSQDCKNFSTGIFKINEAYGEIIIIERSGLMKKLQYQLMISMFIKT